MPRSLFLLIFLLFASFDQPKLVKTKVTDGITVSIPQGWKPMDGLDFNERYPSIRAPLAAFTNDERKVDFSVNISATQWPDANHGLAQKFFKSSLMNMFDRVQILSEGIHEVGEKKYIFFEFESRVNGNRQDEANISPVLKYTYLQYYIEPGRTLVFSFNCPMRDRETWQQTAKAIMKTVKIKS